MKRLLATILSLCLFTQVFCVQAAETTDSQDKQLAAIVQTVKQQIDISSSYTKFYGELYTHDLESQWQLHWDSDAETLYIAVKTDGTILGYSRSVSGSYRVPDGNGYVPKFPDVTAAQLQAAAQSFLTRVLKRSETVVLQKDTDKIMPLRSDRQYFYGDLYYKGVRTPNTVYLSINPEDLSVLEFTRSDVQHVSGIPSETPSVSLANAAKALQSTMKLRLQYSTLGSTDGKASLLYVPQQTDEYYVDAQTGELVNYTALLQKSQGESSQTSRNGAGSSDANSGSGLTPAEQLGADLLKEVLSIDALQAKMRAITELGLSQYTLSTSGYSVSQDTKDVSCFLDFVKKNDTKNTHKYITVDAKTGKLLTLSSSGGWLATASGGSTANITAAQQQTVRHFLSTYFSEEYAQTALLESSPSSDSSVSQLYARQVNGYPFPEQYLQVGINCKDGTIDSFSSAWGKDVSFEDAGTVISADQAMQAFFSAHTVALSYKAVPVSTDNSTYRKYHDLGNDYVLEWKLVYQAQPSRSFYGVNAKGGTLRVPPVTQKTVLNYTDIQAKTYPQIAKLAEYGIGYLGGVFSPQKKLTQEAFLALLLSATGENFDLQDADSRAQIYERAYAYGMLTKKEYAPDSLLTRAAMVKIMITATGYGRTADLAEIYRCRFTDAASIPKVYFGYVATAQGLGLIQGDKNGAFHPQQTATRAQAAILLYNFMSR